MGLRVEEDRPPSIVVGSQSTVVITVIYILHIVLVICILAKIWSLSLLCAYHMVSCIYYFRSQPKQVLSKAVELVDMEKELELGKEPEVDLELVVCRTFYH